MGARRVAVSTARSTATWVDGRFAFGSAALQLGGGRRVAAHPGDGDDVDGAVELPSPRRLRRWRAVRPEDAGTGAVLETIREGCFAADPSGVGSGQPDLGGG